jgi:FAD/FMN-containing dehydrogenase
MLQPNMPLNSTSWPAAMEFFQGLRAEIGENSGYDGLRVYVNYAQGDETPAQIYSETKLPRLVELKNQYDPTNVFRYNHPIPLAYP